MKKAKFSFDKLGEYICVALLLIMTLLTFINVCSRFIFHASIAASEEITTNLFVVLSLVGAGLAAISRSHVGLNVFTDMMKPRMRMFFRVFEGLTGMLFFGVLSWYGFARVIQQYETEMISAGLGMPMYIYGSFCLFGFIVLFAVFAEIAIRAVKSIVKNDFPVEEKEQEVES